MTDRRTSIADAAITTLAREGMRGFTHRAVDRAAGLAEGSTSYYFRTREALLFAVVARMADLDRADIGDLPAGLDLAKLADLMAGVAQVWLTTARDRTVARYELTLESTRRPTLRAKMVEYGNQFRELGVAVVTATGAPDARRKGLLMVASFDGLIYHQLAGAGDLSDADLRAACRDLLLTACQQHA